MMVRMAIPTVAGDDGWHHERRCHLSGLQRQSWDHGSIVPKVAKCGEYTSLRRKPGAGDAQFRGLIYGRDHTSQSARRMGWCRPPNDTRHRFSALAFLCVRRGENDRQFSTRGYQRVVRKQSGASGPEVHPTRSTPLASARERGDLRRKSRPTRPEDEECHDPGEAEQRQPVHRPSLDSCEVGVQKHGGNRHYGDIGGHPKTWRRRTPQRSLTPCAENDKRRHVEQECHRHDDRPTVAFPMFSPPVTTASHATAPKWMVSAPTNPAKRRAPSWMRRRWW